MVNLTLADSNLTVLTLLAALESLYLQNESAFFAAFDGIATKEDGEAALDQHKADLNGMWIVANCILVVWMQAGFGMLESGSVRAKNVSSILFKNLMDFCLGSLGFYTIGYALAFGQGNAFIGYSNFALSEAQNGDGNHVHFFFALVFAATAATIISGAIAERFKISYYFFVTLCMTTFIYPVVVHWVWSDQGWLSMYNDTKRFPCGDLTCNGVIDFAGSGVVHLVGGTAAGVAAWFVGPRHGRYDTNSAGEVVVVDISGHSHVLVSLGTFQLWMGWYGFNCGSTLSITNGHSGLASRVAVNTTIAAAGAGVTACILSRRQGFWDAVATCNGVLTGLVAITAGCATMKPWGACLTGIIAAMIFLVASYVVDCKIRIDDPVSAVAIHACGGFWGLIAAGLFSSQEDIQYAFEGMHDHSQVDHSRGQQLVAQLVAALAIIGWVLVTASSAFFVMSKVGPLRVDLIQELEGLDSHDHGVKPQNSPPFAAWLQPEKKSQRGGGNANKSDMYDSRQFFEEDELRTGVHLLTAPPTTVVLEGKIYVIGGREEVSSGFYTYSQAVDCFDPRTETTLAVAPMLFPRYGCAAVVMDGYIYVLGGIDGSVYLSSTERYDARSDSWEVLPSMSAPRATPAVAACNGYIYVMGGHNQHEYLSLAERFDPGSMSWESLPSMSAERSGCTAVVFKEYIFVMGGVNEEHTEDLYLKTLPHHSIPEEKEQCLPRNEKGMETTTSGPNENTSQSTNNTVSSTTDLRQRTHTSKELRVVKSHSGGMRRTKKLAVVERLHVADKRWERTADLNVPRCYATAAVVRGSLLVLGETHTEEEILEDKAELDHSHHNATEGLPLPSVSTVERYDLHSSTWTLELDSPVTGNRQLSDSQSRKATKAEEKEMLSSASSLFPPPPLPVSSISSSNQLETPTPTPNSVSSPSFNGLASPDAHIEPEKDQFVVVSGYIRDLPPDKDSKHRSPGSEARGGGAELNQLKTSESSVAAATTRSSKMRVSNNNNNNNNQTSISAPTSASTPYRRTDPSEVNLPYPPSKGTKSRPNSPQIKNDAQFRSLTQPVVSLSHQNKGSVFPSHAPSAAPNFAGNRIGSPKRLSPLQPPRLVHSRAYSAGIYGSHGSDNKAGPGAGGGSVETSRPRGNSDETSRPRGNSGNSSNSSSSSSSNNNNNGAWAGSTENMWADTPPEGTPETRLDHLQQVPPGPDSADQVGLEEILDSNSLSTRRLADNAAAANETVDDYAREHLLPVRVRRTTSTEKSPQRSASSSIITDVTRSSLQVLSQSQSRPESPLQETHFRAIPTRQSMDDLLI
eukprot:g50786.t1